MRSPGSTLVLLTAVLILGTAVPVAAAAPAPCSAAGLAVSASATPSYGAAPLLVRFSSSVAGSTPPTTYNWSFGDGTYLNGTTSAASDPTHLYELPANYTAQVTIHVGAEFGSASILVHVATSDLAVAVRADRQTGVTPFTVTFLGNVTGGTGTYIALNWTFGDGATGTGSSVQYTYTRPGRFYASLTVEDSDGSHASGGVWINVSAGSPDASSGPTGNGEVEWAGIGFALGLALALLVFPIRSWLLRSRGQDPDPATSPPAAPDRSEERPSSPEPPAATAEPAQRPAAPSPPGETMRTSERILIHLAGQGVLGPYDVAPPGLTQAGISTALGVRQNTLTNALRRLTDAGLIETELRHVQGQPRRLKVYRLTPRGEILARELRHRRPPRSND